MYWHHLPQPTCLTDGPNRLTSLGDTLDAHLIPAQTLHVVSLEEITLGLHLGQVIDVLSCAAKLIHKDPTNNVAW